MLLRFHWYEKVYFLEEETSFLSESRESIGDFVGISEHVGHELCFLVLSPDTNNILSRPRIRSAEDPSSTIFCVERDAKNQIIQSPKHKTATEDREPEEKHHPMAIVDVEDFVGKSFDLPSDEGNMATAEIVEGICHHEDKKNSN